MTYAIALENAIKAVGAETEVGEKLVALKAQIEAKAQNRKPRVNKEKVELTGKVVEAMEYGVDYKCAELAKVLGVSTQKLAPALKDAVKAGAVERHVEKRVALYRLVEGE